MPRYHVVEEESKYFHYYVEATNPEEARIRVKEGDAPIYEIDDECKTEIVVCEEAP